MVKIPKKKENEINLFAENQPKQNKKQFCSKRFTRVSCARKLARATFMYMQHYYMQMPDIIATTQNLAFIW